MLEDSQETVQAEAEGAVEETPVTASQEGERKTEPTLSTAEILKRIEENETKIKVFQSEKDKSIAELGRSKKREAELERENATLKATLDGLRSDYREDPDITTRISQREKDAKLLSYEEQAKAQREAEAEQVRQAQIAREFFADLNADLEDYGLDLNDKRLIEVGKTVPVGNFRELRRAVIKEAKRIKGESKVEDSTYQTLQAEIDNLKKQLGMQSNEALPPVSAGGGKVFTAKQIDKMSPAEYAKNREAILTAQKEGRIK